MFTLAACSGLVLHCLVGVLTRSLYFTGGEILGDNGFSESSVSSLLLPMSSRSEYGSISFHLSNDSGSHHSQMDSALSETEYLRVCA